MFADKMDTPPRLTFGVNYSFVRQNRMPFTSSPTMDNTDATDSAPGTCIGGASQDAGRVQQLEAMRSAKAKEDAQAAVLENARVRAERRAVQEAEESEERARNERREQREQFTSALCWGLGAVALAALAYMAQDAYRHKSTGDEYHT